MYLSPKQISVVSAPASSPATEIQPAGCWFFCSGGCSGCTGCQGTCSGDCTGDCFGCKGTCDGCTGGCTGCGGSCVDHCDSSNAGW